MINRGAKTLLVPNNFPIGCIPRYLTQFQSPKKEDYDPQTGCIKSLNEFAEYHNAMLLEELEKLRLLYPDVIIIYADYYEASMNIFRNPKKLGKKKQATKILFDYCISIYVVLKTFILTF